jgi:hypothetical protein
MFHMLDNEHKKDTEIAIEMKNNLAEHIAKTQEVLSSLESKSESKFGRMHLLEKKTLSWIKEFRKSQVENNNMHNASIKMIKTNEISNRKDISRLKAI